MLSQSAFHGSPLATSPLLTFLTKLPQGRIIRRGCTQGRLATHGGPELGAVNCQGSPPTPQPHRRHARPSLTQPQPTPKLRPIILRPARSKSLRCRRSRRHRHGLGGRGAIDHE